MTVKTVVIMRGTSGSGKSTYISKHLAGALVCSADHFFHKDDGSYEFDVRKLGAAHEACKRKFKKALKQGEPLVVVDNTNTKMWEMKPYIMAARHAGYELEFVRMDTPVEVAAARNVHGVPQEAVQKMADRMQELPDDPARKEKVVEGVSR